MTKPTIKRFRYKEVIPGNAIEFSEYTPYGLVYYIYNRVADGWFEYNHNASLYSTHKHKRVIIQNDIKTTP